MSDALGVTRYRFGKFTLDCGARALLREGAFLSLTPKEFETLSVLVESAGKAVDKERLVARVWPDTFVGDGSLARNISVLRKHLGAEAIETVSKYGYRFALQVSVELTAHEAIPISRHVPVERQSEPRSASERDANSVVAVSVFSRFQQFRRNRLLILTLCFFGLVASLFLATRHHRQKPSFRSEPERIAVLPFKTLGSQPVAEYLSDGFAEELITSLGQISRDRLRVLDLGTTSQYRGTTQRPADIAKNLDVRYLVDGTITLIGQDAHLTVHLVDGKDQSILWNGRYDRPVSDLPSIQGEITESIAREVQAQMVPAELGDLRTAETAYPLAHDEFLHGRSELEKKSVPAFWEALEHFTNATVIDPKYARAYAGISETFINLAFNTPPRQAYAKAKDAAVTAIKLNERMAEGHRDLAWVLFNNEGDLQRAEREYRRALQLNPSDARTRHWYSQFLMAQRKGDEAVREARAGLDLDPLSLSSNYNYGIILIDAGQPQAGLDHLQALLQREPENEVVYGYIGMGYARLHQYDKAVVALQRAMDISKLKYQYQAGMGYALAKNGEVAKAQLIADELNRKMNDGIWIPSYNMAELYVGLEQKDKAIFWLQRCVDDRTCGLLEVNNEPLYSSLSGDPRFSTIVSRLSSPAAAGATR